MSLVFSTVRDGGMARDLAPGDTINGSDLPLALVNAAAVTLSAQQAMSGILLRSGPAGAFADLVPDANTLIAGMLGQQAYLAAGASAPLGVNPNSNFRLLYVNNGGGIMTLTTNTGVTLVGTMTIAAGSIKEFLLQILNGTPQQVFAATTANTSAVITGLNMAQTQALSVGMAVTGTGIPASTTIISIQPGVGVTLSANATATGALVALTFAPRYQVTSLGARLA